MYLCISFKNLDMENLNLSEEMKMPWTEGRSGLILDVIIVHSSGHKKMKRFLDATAIAFSKQSEDP